MYPQYIPPKYRCIKIKLHMCKVQADLQIDLFE